jgi:hypothetical protein
MTDQPEQPDQAGEAPAPGAAPGSAPALFAPEPPAGDAPSRIADLEAELARLRADAAPAGALLMRIAPGDAVSSITVGGVTVTKDPSPVPPHLAGDLRTAAADAGVDVTDVTEET